MGWARDLAKRVRRALEGPPPPKQPGDEGYVAPPLEPWSGGWVPPLDDNWRVDTPAHQSSFVIRHHDVPVRAEADYCRLSYEIVSTPGGQGSRLGITDIRTERCDRREGLTKGHAKALLREMHRLEPQYRDWWFTTDLTTDGRTFFTHVAPWIMAEFGVTLHLPPPLI